MRLLQLSNFWLLPMIQPSLIKRCNSLINSFSCYHLVHVNLLRIHINPLLESCLIAELVSRRSVWFEYIIIEGVTDAEEVAAILLPMVDVGSKKATLKGGLTA